MLFRQNDVLFGVLKNDLGARDQRGREKRVRVAALSVWQISISTVRHEYPLHVVRHYFVVVNLNADLGGLGIPEETDIRAHVSSGGGIKMRHHGCAWRSCRCKECSGHES